MPRPGRVGPGVRIAVQWASSMDALRAEEVKAPGRVLSGLVQALAEGVEGGQESWR